MKKVLVSMLAAVMVLGSTMTVMAAPSVNTEDVKVEVTEATVATLAEKIDESKTVAKTEDGTVIAHKIEAVKAEDAAKISESLESEVTKVVAAANETGKAHTGELVGLANVTVPTATPEQLTAGIKLTIAVDGITAADTKDTVKVLHHDGTKWEVLEVSAVAEGTVTATFHSFSPVAVVKVAEKAADTGVGFSALSLIAAAGLVGTVVCGKKRAK